MAERVSLHVVYRITGRENAKPRPPYYSKLLCLVSFLRAVRALPEPPELVFLVDGDLPAGLGSLVDASGERLAAPRSGHVPTYLRALALPRERSWADVDVVYLAEDDYLHAPGSLEALAAAARELSGASYFGLAAAVDWRRRHSAWVGERLWVTAESTTYTYGARVGALRRDAAIHSLASRAGRQADTEACLAYQGSRPYPWLRLLGDALHDEPLLRRPADSGPAWRAKRAVARGLLNLLALRAALRPHVLVAPVPHLAGHLELSRLDDGVDWEALALDTARWGRETLGVAVPGLPGGA